MKTIIAACCTAAALLAPAAAQAHVTLQPDQAPAGGFTRLDVRVPNERDDAGTVEVQVKFPPGFATASTEPVPGWTAKVTKRTATTPIELHGETTNEEVDTVTWTGDGRQGIVRPGQFQDFGLSLATPDQPGKALTFKALQTYEGGEVVRWIGPADADEPAPQVTLTAADEQHGAPVGGEGAATEEGAAVQAAGTDASDDGAPTWLVIVALGLGAGGLAAGVAGLRAARKGSA